MTTTGAFDLEPPMGASSFQPTPSPDLRTEPKRERGVFGKLLHGLAAPFSSPRFYYGCAVVVVAFVLFTQFSPELGTPVVDLGELAWPWASSWTEDHVRCLGLALAGLAMLVALFLPARRSRGTWALIWSGLAFTALNVGQWSSTTGSFWLLLVFAGGATAGALLMRRHGPPSGRYVLLASACVLACLLFLPASVNFTTSAGVETVKAYGAVPAWEQTEEQYKEYAHPTLQDWLPRAFWLRLDVFLGRMRTTLVLLVLLLGVLSLVGLGGRWAGGLAGFLMFALAVGLMLSDYHDGYVGRDDAALTAFQNGLRSMGNALFWPTAFLLPVVGGLADLGLGGRRP